MPITLRFMQVGRLNSSFMTYKVFTSTFKLRVTKASYDSQLHLAISVCKKLFFDYQVFFDKNNWGDPDILLEAIKMIENTGYPLTDKNAITNMIDSVVAVTPDTEDFGDASYALSACTAICETLGFLADKDSKHIYKIGTCLTDNIDFKLQEDADLTDKEIDRHPLMIEARTYLLTLAT